MPCHVSESQEIYSQFRHNSDVAAMLCSIIEAIGIDKLLIMIEEGRIGINTEEINDWWKEHVDRDKNRLKDDFKMKLEQYISEYMKSINYNERKLLGEFKIKLYVLPDNNYKNYVSLIEEIEKEEIGG